MGMSSVFYHVLWAGIFELVRYCIGSLGLGGIVDIH